MQDLGSDAEQVDLDEGEDDDLRAFLDRYEEAFEAITATNPFSSICGRVCDAPCEPACRRVDSDGAVQIRNLKRFVMDKLGATRPGPSAPWLQLCEPGRDAPSPARPGWCTG